MKTRNHIVSSGHYSKLLGIMKYPMGAMARNWDFFIKAKSHKPEVTNRL